MATPGGRGFHWILEKLLFKTSSKWQKQKHPLSLKVHAKKRAYFFK
jgi:hypothetical protein